MKKLILTCIALCFFAVGRADNYDLPFSVGFSKNWGNGYPVIRDLYNNEFFDITVDVENVYIELDENKRFVPTVPIGIYDIVREINGVDVKGMDDNALSELCRGRDTLYLVTERMGFSDKGPIHVKMVQKNNADGIAQGYKKPLKINPNLKLPEGVRIISDSEVDFFRYKTYDILIEGDDPLTDKKILEEFCSHGLFGTLKRDQENPDLIVTIAKNADESISSTYVPPTMQQINTGSMTRPVFNYITRTTSYVTEQRYRTETTKGYTKTTTTSSIYLEIAVLDAKKMNDPKQKYAPIIWQMTYGRTVADRQFELLDEYLAIASWNCYPFTDIIHREYGSYIRGFYMKNNDVVSKVYAGSQADKIGLRAGDKIIKIDGMSVDSPLKKLLLKDDRKDYSYRLRKYKPKTYQLLTLFGGNSYSRLTNYAKNITVLRNGEVVELKGQLYERYDKYHKSDYYYERHPDEEIKYIDHQRIIATALSKKP